MKTLIYQEHTIIAAHELTRTTDGNIEQFYTLITDKFVEIPISALDYERYIVGSDIDKYVAFVKSPSNHSFYGYDLPKVLNILRQNIVI